MMSNKLLLVVLFLVPLSAVIGQQRVDMNYRAEPLPLLFKDGLERRVLVDNSHNNLHTIETGYAPFAQQLERMGCSVKSANQISRAELDQVDIYVTANALNIKNRGQWHKPIHRAYLPYEVKVLKEWVNDGGAVFIIVDHMPFSGAMNDLVSAFGFTMDDGFAMPQQRSFPTHVFNHSNGLNIDCDEDLKSVATFTGSAFKIPKEATSVLSFSDTDYYLMPDTAWVFNKETPSYSLDGYHQLAYRAYGRGKVVLCGEAAMFTAQLVQDTIKAGFNHRLAQDNIKLLSGIIHYLASDSEDLCLPDNNQVPVKVPFMNSDSMEHSPTWDQKNRRVYFTRRNGFYKALNKSAIYYSDYRNRKWSEPKVALFSGVYSDSSPFIDYENEYIYFVSDRPIEDKSEKGASKNLYRVRLDAPIWVENLNILNSDQAEYSPTLDKVGNIYFGSYREGGMGSGDLWMARKEGYGWSVPENLGPGINTPGGEWGSCISADGQCLIYEASGRPQNITNDGDLYLSKFNNEKWSESTHLKELSSHGSDLAPRLHNRELYFSSNRTEDLLQTMQNNDVDIYSVPLDRVIKKQVTVDPMWAHLQSLLDEIEDHYRSGDLNRIADYYTERAEMYGPRGPKVVGREAMNTYWVGLQGRQADWKLDIIDFESFDDVYKTIITSELGVLKDNKKQVHTTRAVLIWKKEMGEWKIDLDFYHGL